MGVGNGEEGFSDGVWNTVSADLAAAQVIIAYI
jgi:hypothetical protein